MNRPFRHACLALCAFALATAASVASAAGLTPYQKSALDKLLAAMPAEHRAMARPQLEASLARMGKAEIDMMLAAMATNGTNGTNGAGSMGGNEGNAAGSAPDAGEWGKAEADYARVFPQMQAYIATVSDLRDAAAARWDQQLRALSDEFARSRVNSFTNSTALETCNAEMNGVPLGRRKIPGLEETHAEQDRIMTRLMLENRARYGTLDKFAQQLGQPVSSPLVQAAKHHFAAPMTPDEVKARLASIDSQLGALLESSSRELHKIRMTAYPDQGSGITSKLQQKDLDALRDKTAKAAVAICAPGKEAYERGLLGWLAPLVPKVKPYLN